MMQPCITNHFSQIYHEEKGDKVNDNAMNTVKENIYVVDLYFILLGEAQINYRHNEVKEGISILEDHLKGGTSLRADIFLNTFTIKRRGNMRK